VKRQALVLEQASSGSALVALQQSTSCERCRQAGGCVARFVDDTSVCSALHIACATDIPVREGQHVIVEIEENGSGWLWTVFGAFGIPLFFMLLACATASFLTARVGITAGEAPGAAAELSIALASALGLAGGIFAWRFIAPLALGRAQRSFFLHSARIVSIIPLSERPPR